ncbi:MAG: DNA mismatch repair protein MutS [Halobacteriovoraceae bacterium]|nr:DNA mismatch repair protein MutS [Halobacteriovoraceae bacterium]|tara:strand:+ start:29510 stop:32158 length:2649 start_codon:yes stop_codon:yes gene_type:complete
MTNNSTLGTLEMIIESGTKLTPMMEQYYQIKKEYQDILLMFRMGDFYELFFEDARLASKLLNISLTHRGKIGDFPIPMSGIPHHAANTYIDRITMQGHKVAICEQVEDPKEAKGIVKRAVTQVVSPGMPYDLDKSETKSHSYMACLSKEADTYYAVFIDYTTGDFFGLALSSMDDVIEKLMIYAPKELISFMGQWDAEPKLAEYLSSAAVLQTYLSHEYFAEKFSAIYIEKIIPTYKRDQVIKLNPGIIPAIGALSYYIYSTQGLESLSHIRPFAIVNNEEAMKVSYPTLIGLEIFPKSRETYKDSLLGFLDHCQTSMGTRKLKAVLQSPLRSEADIQNRFAGIEYFLERFDGHKELRAKLYEVRDIDRIMAKVATKKVNGSDLINLANAIDTYLEVKKELKGFPKGLLAKLSKKDLELLASLSKKIAKTINDEVGANLEKGNLIKAGCSKKRDQLFKLCTNATDALIELETKYRKKTGINNLKIKNNNVAGYFIEVSKSHVSKVPKDFVRRQTLVNSERYQTDELAEFEREMVCAQDKLLKLERKIFNTLVTEIENDSTLIMELANAIAMLDVMQSFAWVALQEDFTKPKIVSTKLLNIKQAWHPLIKSNIQDQFVCHDLILDEEKYFGLITGPNMAGKTTVMREMAIIQFLTQVGSFVPAQSAELGLVDYLFSRLGASDDIIKGQSTFMVEMSETAEIIRHATENSLIILDEIGRGTSTYDGLSIAWSLVEYFVDKTRAKTLFSTHYHELIELVDTIDAAKNLTVKTINTNGHVEFLYQLIEEGAAQSYGIHVAKLAGLPTEVLNRSSQILAKLESENENQNLLNDVHTNQLDMFGMATEKVYEEVSSPVLEELKNLDINNLTPLQAMQKLNDLRATLKN